MTVRTDRPRLLLSPSILATLKARAAAGTQRWNVLKAIADRPGAGWEDAGLAGYALVYQVTGDLQYAQKALTLMQQSMAAGTAQASNPAHLPTMGKPAAGPQPTGTGEISGDSGYQCRNYFPAASLCYDWCWSAMTAVERAALRADLEACAAWVFPETNAARKGAWSIDDAGNNYFHGFMTTWMAGLALAGDSDKAQGILDLCQNKWDTLVLPYLRGPAAGGVFCEGTSYGVDSLRSMRFYTQAYATATGSSVPGAAGWLVDATTALVHLTVPGMDALVPWGDQTKSSGGALQDAARSPMLIAANNANMDAHDWLLRTTPDRMTQRNNQWEEFLHFPEVV